MPSEFKEVIGVRDMYLKFFISSLIFILFSLFSSFVYAKEKVGEVWALPDAAIPEGRISYIDPIEGIIYEVDLNGFVTWKYKIPSKINNKRTLRKGADIEWLKDSDNFLFVVPLVGIYEVNRQKEIVWSYETKLVSHDADRLPNGNTIFVNAWDKEGDNQVVEITPKGDIVFEWKISDSGVSCAHKTADCNRGKSKGRKYDYTHVNAVQKFEDGSFLVSLRNLHKAVLIDKSLKVVERYRRIHLVHDPRLEGNELIAVDRRAGLIKRDRQPISSRPDSKYVFKYLNHGYSFLRTNELIPDGNILLTDTSNLLVFNFDSEKIVWKLKLNGFGDQKINKELPFLFKAAWSK
jgi:hypothetical protein